MVNRFGAKAINRLQVTVKTPPGQEGLPAAQQVCRHAAGHFAEEADDVIHAFGQADLPQGEAPGRQQGHPYRIVMRRPEKRSEV